MHISSITFAYTFMNSGYCSGVTVMVNGDEVIIKDDVEVICTFDREILKWRFTRGSNDH
jgi:hypothetical protein